MMIEKLRKLVMEQLGRKKIYRLGTAHMIAGSFFLAILVGGLVLMLPICSAKGTWTPFIDALFTSTTSVCVTGLVTVVTATHWSLVGQVVIMLLIQLGGIGVIAVIIMFSIVIGRRISLKERMIIQDAYNLDKISGTVKVILQVVKVSLLIEAIGAFFYSFQFIPEFGLWRGVYYSIFHSISAFCNAGIDVIGDNSLMNYVSNPLVNVTTMALIVVGGIGFPVWWDIQRVLKEYWGKGLGVKKIVAKLSVHSKLAIVMTVGLIVLGALGIFVFEYSNVGTIGNLNLFDKVQASLFQSVTTRTAGYLTVPQDKLRDASVILSIILMLAGGSPAGTAGGIKTTTIGMILFTIYSFVKGKNDTEIFQRKIPKDNVRSGLTVISIILSLFFVSSMMLMAVDNLGFVDSLYEVASAVATVGLSRGITPQMSVLGKLIIIANMYMGRIGSITVVLLLHIKHSGSNCSRELPEKRILVG